jgi:hypothetical protein
MVLIKIQIMLSNLPRPSNNVKPVEYVIWLHGISIFISTATKRHARVEPCVLTCAFEMCKI